MLRTRYVPLVERERLAHKYLDLRHRIDSVTKITKMFIDRTLFCPEFAACKQAQMTRYLSMLKKDIRQFVSTQHYGTLVELQEASRRREIELELHTREQRQGPMQSQPVANWFKVADVRSRSQKGRTCGKCDKVHEGPCRSTFGCHKYVKEGYYAKDCRQQVSALTTRICYHCE